MKKRLKKFLSQLVPKGAAKERLKLSYYNLVAPKGISFSLGTSGRQFFHTHYHGLSLNTIDPLYNIAPDFGFYTHFHHIQPGEVILDAGANNGYVSLFFSGSVGSTGKVYAFEPDAINIARIKENLAMNAGTENITIEALLLWNENTEIDFYQAGTVGSSAVWKPDGEKLVKKRAVTIDSWVKERNISKLDFIKMDIEGAEIEAIEGCVHTIATLKPDFAIASYHIVNGQPTHIKLEEFFSKIGYPHKTVRFKKNEIITFAGPSLHA